MAYGVRQFVTTDPGGNMIRIGQPIGQAVASRADARLGKAFEAASMLMYSKGDPQMAARVIDDALAATTDARAASLTRARILRADAAHALGDDARAASLLVDVEAAPLGADERAAMEDDLARAAELRLVLA